MVPDALQGVCLLERVAGISRDWMYSGNGVTTLPSSIGHVWAMVWRLVEKISILPDGVASGFATGSVSYTHLTLPTNREV